MATRPARATPRDGDDTPQSVNKRGRTDETERRSAKRARVEDDDDDGNSVSQTQEDPAAADGFSSDEATDTEELEQPPTLRSVPQSDRTRDVQHFFSDVITENGKKMRHCRECSKTGHPKSLVNEASTLRRHLQSKHAAKYRKWAKEHDFKSMLPDDCQARRAKTTAIQTQLEDHSEKMAERRIIPYTDAAFREAAIEWLVATDQPIQALEHPKFANMIDIASRATNGVKIPDRKQTRAEIISTFQKQVDSLKQRLNSPKVTGLVSLTFDAWQASNTDSYQAVTGSWVEEVKENKFEVRSALLGFTRLNSSHDGETLGRALYKVVARLGIAHRIGWITCDNASNNNTALVAFARRLKEKGFVWDPEDRRIRCLAHIVNLATQALISTYSKSKHYNPNDPDDEIHVEHSEGDEVGLVRALAAKERSSSKRKELFLKLQEDAGRKSLLQLLLDMPVRWSSTHAMLFRTYELRPFINPFIDAMVLAEKDKGRKRKLRQLQLTDEEWKRLKRFLGLLSHADDAQQAFSSDQGPSLHLAIPALEALHQAWFSKLESDKHSEFSHALEAATTKINEYYNRTAESDAYTFVMFLDPEHKGDHIKCHWGDDLYQEALKRAEYIYKQHYLKLVNNGTISSAQPSTVHRSARSKLKRLLTELDSDSDSDTELRGTSFLTQPRSETSPWLEGFNRYINTPYQLGKLTIMEFWGYHALEYPVWFSLARDYLPIMASSTSSERAFSSAGITISKRRNRLKGDIVEALQFLKCSFRKDLIFRKFDLLDEDLAEHEEDGTKAEEGWDAVLEDTPENDDDSDAI